MDPPLPPNKTTHADVPSDTVSLGESLLRRSAARMGSRKGWGLGQRVYDRGFRFQGLEFRAKISGKKGANFALKVRGWK